VKRVAVVWALGAMTNRAVIAVESAGLASVREAEEASREFEKGTTLFLDTREESVKRARKSAETSPELSAQLLARVILLDRLGALPESLNDALLELASGAQA
jgi:hypothetical protein